MSTTCENGHAETPVKAPPKSNYDPHRVARIGTRLDILSFGIKQGIAELEDNAVRHVKPCKCGRASTRFGECALCVMDRLREERLK